MISNSMLSPNVRSEHGGILVLFALLAIAIFTLIGLTVDTAMWASAKTGAKQSAQFAALAALERYSETAQFFTQSAKSGTMRLHQAALRASEVAGLNIQTLAAVRTLGDIKTTSINHITTNQNTPGKNGYIVPGVWHFAEPKRDPGTGLCKIHADRLAGQSCPCGDTGADPWKGPCFEQFKSETNANINAIKVHYNTDTTHPLKTFFSKVYSSINGGAPTPTFDVSVEAIATVVPRRAAFVMDLSASMTEDSHRRDISKPKTSPRLWGSYAFEVTPGETCVQPDSRATPLSFTDNGGSFPTPGCGTLNAGSSCFLGIGQQLVMECIPFGRGAGENNIPAVCTDPTLGLAAPGGTIYPPLNKPSLHRQKDYECISEPPAGTSAQFPGTIPQTFLVDTNLTANASNPRPEPISSMLDGIHQAMLTIQSRAIAADAIAVIGFDDQLLDIRATKDKNGYIPGLVNSDEAEFAAFLKATDTSSPYNKFTRFLFPRTLSTRNTGILDSNSNSDLYTALNETAKMLNRDPLLGAAETHVLLFSDTLTNCVSSTTLASMPPGSASCDSFSVEHHIKGLLDSLSIINDTFITNNIHLNLFLTGNSVAPHTLVLKGDQNTPCMSDQLAREGNYSFVDTGLSYPKTPAEVTAFFSNPANQTAYQSASTETPWLIPNQMYGATTSTSGLWVPLRPPCPGGKRFRQELDKACQKSSAKKGSPIGRVKRLLRRSVKDRYGEVIFPQAIDDQSRLLCDPDGKTKNQQVSDAIAKLLSQNPYLLVSE